MNKLIIVFFLFFIGNSVIADDKANDKVYPKSDKFGAVERYPEIIQEIVPEYPVELENKSVNGDVWIKCLIDTNGDVLKAMVMKSSGYEAFDSSAVQASYACKYKPAFGEGKKLPIWISYIVVFSDDKTAKKMHRLDGVCPGPNDFVQLEVMPEMTRQNPPTYPKEMKKKRKSGNVWIKCLMNKNGDVVKAMVGKSSGIEAFDLAALEASYGYKFKPGYIYGQPVAAWVTYKVTFKKK